MRFREKIRHILKIRSLFLVFSVMVFVLCFFFSTAIAESSASQAHGKVITHIGIKGLVVTKEHVVKRELFHRVSELFQFNQWRKEKGRLEGLDIFSKIDLEFTIQGDSVALKYIFEELPKVIPFIGGKKTDQDGFIIGPAIAALNSGGKDIRLEAYARIGGNPFLTAREFQAVASSRWLWGLPVDTWFQYILTDNYNALADFPELSHFFLAAFKQRLGTKWKLKYKTEWLSITTDEGSADSIIISIGLFDHIIRLGSGIVFDNRETIFNTRNGQYAEFMYTQSMGDVQFGEILGDYRIFYSLGRRHILHAAALAQYRIGQVGIYDRFYVGGANTLRAYDPITEGLSGSSEILGFLEYRYDWILQKDIKMYGLSWYYGIQLIAGVDWAYLWNRDRFSEGRDGRSVYIGLHILFPGLDRIRFEIGNNAMRFKLDSEFSFGLWERTTSQRWRIR